MSKTFKRFYKAAAAVAADDGFAIRLDGKAVKTPGGRGLVVPSAALAEAVAAEWNAQGEMVAPHSMPLTQLASTALDRVGPERAHICAELLRYAGTDLLSYRVDHPAELVSRQTKGWQPILDWAATQLDAPMLVTTGLVAVAQPPQSLEALGRALEALDVWRLAAVSSAASALGSLLLALALEKGRLDSGQAFALSQIDETFQMEQWGEDYEAADRRAELAADIDAAGRFLALLRSVSR